MELNKVNLNDRDDIIFHFRNAESVLKFDELKNLEIYFCPYDSEDDAAEGLMNVYWKADEILWNNFFAQYFVVFYVHYIMILFAEEDDRKIPDQIYWKQPRALFNLEGLIQRFLDSQTVTRIKIIAMAKNHEVSADELKLYLRIVHGVAVSIVWSIDHEINDMFCKRKRNLDDASLTETVNNLKWNEENTYGIFRVLEQFLEKNEREAIATNGEEWKRWLFIDFPKEYFKCLPEMIYPRWYIASFCKDCTSARNWAHYADASRGICLIHKTYNCAFGKGLKIKTCHEFSTHEGRKYENHIEPLLDVEYNSNFPRFNFFEMLGGLTGGMVDEWFHDRNGNKSPYHYGDYADPKKEEWRRNYWRAYQRHITSKSVDWQELKEQRVVLEDDGLFSNYSTLESRKIKYDFDELKGIIWGIRINDKVKAQIREIVEDHCTQMGRTDFSFYQARINPSNGNIWIEKEL